MKRSPRQILSIIHAVYYAPLALVLFGNAFAQQADSSSKTLSASHNCPVGYSYSLYGGPMARYEIEGLSKKKYTISQFEEFTKEIESVSSEADRENQRGKSYMVSLDPPNDTYRDLSGCKLTTTNNNFGTIGNCTVLQRNLPKDSFSDTITPRLEVLKCHQKAGWPTAIDSKSNQSSTDNTNGAASSRNRGSGGDSTGKDSKMTQGCPFLIHTEHGLVHEPGSLYCHDGKALSCDISERLGNNRFRYAWRTTAHACDRLPSPAVREHNAANLMRIKEKFFEEF